MDLCERCQNLMTPEASTGSGSAAAAGSDANQLHLVCRNCGHRTLAIDGVVSRRIMSGRDHVTSSAAHYINDPTLTRTIHRPCPNEACPSKIDPSKQEAVTQVGPDLRMRLTCCACNETWSLS